MTGLINGLCTETCADVEEKLPGCDKYQEREIVRCKDCRHFREIKGKAFYYCHCVHIHHAMPNGNWFCADGVRKHA